MSQAVHSHASLTAGRGLFDGFEFGLESADVGGGGVIFGGRLRHDNVTLEMPKDIGRAKTWFRGGHYGHIE